ncbi:MAG: OmpP1/FadL family transporter [Hyphomicrobiales bacterium]
MKKNLLCLIAIISFIGVVKGQGAYDAIRFARLNPGGTARSVSMGGAFGALGGDPSSLSLNPAGLGVYRSSEFSVTPVITLGNAKSTYLNETNTDGRGVFNFGNIGLIFSNEIPNRLNTDGFRFVNFGISLNRMADFNNRYMMTGNNRDISRVDIWIDQSFHKTTDELTNENGSFIYGPGLAYETYLINPLEDSEGRPFYNSFVPDLPKYNNAPEAFLRQEQTTETRGSLNEWDFSVAANYNDILYMGFTLGVPYFRYMEDRTFREENVNNLGVEPGKESGFNYYEYKESYEMYGTGINLKGGIIVKPVDFLRVGISAHTPTWYPNVNFSYSTSMTADVYVDDPDNDKQGFFENYSESPINEFKYNLRTPYRLMGSLAFLFGQYGLISAEYEYVDYTNSKLKASDYSFRTENQDIQNNYKSANNFRIGTEWRLMSFSFRGGFNYQESPFESSDFKNAKACTYSLGVGYKNQNVFMDLGWSLTTTNDDFYLYNYSREGLDIISDLAKNKVTLNRFLFTIGYRF